MKAKILQRTSIYKGVVLEVEQRELLLDNGRHFTLDFVGHPGAAAAVALDEAGRVLLVRQQRHAVGEDLLELPAGLREEGEDPLLCAKRELEEEAGVVAEHWTPLGEVFTSPGCFSERIFLFAARGLRKTQQNLDADEQIEVVELPLAEAVARALDGTLLDAKTVVGLLRANALFCRNENGVVHASTAAPEPTGSAHAKVIL